MNEQLEVFPAASVTVKTSVETPIGKVDPLGKPDVNSVLATVQLSVPVAGAKLTTAVQSAESLLTEILAGQVTVGKILSDTLTVKAQVEVFPATSVARNVSVVNPAGKDPPDPVPVNKVVETTPAQLSVAVAEE